MSVDISTLALEVKSDAVALGSSRLDQLTKSGANADSSSSKLTSTLDRLGYSTKALTGYIEAAVAAFAAWKLAELAKDAALLAARYDTLGVVMKITGKNAAYTNSQMLEFQAGLQRTGISAIEARSGLIRMGQAQIDFANSSKLARIAQDAAVVGNINSSEAFQRMMTGLATGQSIILHHLGLMTNFEQAYINAAHAAGKTAADLSEAEKAQIRVNEVFRAGIGIQGAYEAAMTTVGKQLTSLPRYIQDLMVKMGEAGQGPLFSMVSGLTDALKWLTKNFETVSEVAGTLGTGAAVVGIGMLTAKVEAFVYAAHVAQLQTIALRDNTLLDAAAATASAETRNAEAVAIANSARSRIAAIDAQIAETKAAFWASNVYKERVALDAQLIALEQDRARVVGQLGTAEAAAATTATALATATEAEAVAMSEASLASRAMSGAMAGLNTTLALVGGPIGAIAIAIAGITYEIIKFQERAERAQTQLAQLSNQGDFAQTLAKLKEIEDLNRKLEQDKKSPADVAKENTALMQEKINKAVRENVELERKRQALIASHDNQTASETWTGKATEWDKVNAKIRDNNNLIKYGARINDEMNAALAKQNRLRKDMHPTSAPEGDEYTVDLKAYNDEVEKWRQLDRANAQAMDRQKLDDTKNASELQLQALKNQHDQGLISTKDFLAAEHQERVKAANANIVLLEDAVKRAKEAHDNASWDAFVPKPAYGTSTESTVAADNYNKLQENEKKTLVELTKAQTELNNAKAEAAIQNERDKGASIANDTDLVKQRTAAEIQLQQAIGNTIAAIELQNKQNDIDRRGMDDTTRSILEQVDAMKLLAAQQQQQIQNQQALDALKQQNDTASATLVGTNNEGGFNTIADQVANQLAVQEDAHRQRMKNIEDEQIAAADAAQRGVLDAEHYAARRQELDRKTAYEQRKNAQTVTKITNDGYRAQLAEAGNYTSMAGQMFTLLASVQDQSSRAGFESAKAYNIAATVMNTASAIMSAMAAPWPMSIAAAALAAATGAIQIAKIESTSYGGGGSVAAPAAGSFSSGGGGASSSVGSSRGADYTSAADSQSLEAMKRLAASVDNASVAMRRVSDGLTTFAGMLGGNSAQMALGSVNGRYSSIYDPGIISKVTGSIFGGKWHVTGAGVELGIDDGEFAGRGYTTSKKKGGWFKSDKHRTDYDDLSAGFADMMDISIKKILSQVDLGSALLGTTNAASSLSIPVARIATAGRKPEDIQKDVEAWLQKVGNEFAKTVQGLEAFAAPGEEAYAALIRLTTALQGANEYFQLIGKTLFNSTLEGANQASKLVELMGGGEKFAQAMDDYFTGGMFTEAQQKAALAAQATLRVNEVFAELGRTVPTSRQEFIDLVNSLDTTTEAGAQAFQALMLVQGAFVTMTEAAEDAAKKTQEAYINTALAAADALREILGGDLSTLSPEEKYRAQQRAFADAQAAGNTAAMPELAKALLAASRDYNGSGAGYAADYATVTQALATIAGMPETSELTLTAVQTQVQLLTDIKAILDGTSTSSAAAQAAIMATAGNMPGFATGTPFVPYDMYANIHQGEIIIDRQSADVLRKYGIRYADNYADNSALIAEIRALREEVVQLRQESVGKLTSIDTKARLAANA